MSKIDDHTTMAKANDLVSASSGAALVIYHRDGVKVVPLHEGVAVVVGRVWPADVVVPDLSLSRKHAQICWRKDGIEIEDLGSTNGTFVRGERATKARIAPGETVALGDVTLSVNISTGDEALQGIEGHEKFVGRLEDEVVRSRSFGRPLALAMIRAISVETVHIGTWLPRVRSALRPVDRLSVYGPNSALVLMPELTPSECSSIVNNAVRTSGEPPLVCGVATFPMASSSHELIDVARRASRAATLSDPVHFGAEEDHPPAEGMIAVSEPMRELMGLIHRVAAVDIPILIRGETGVGKEVAARSIHQFGPRRSGPQRSINCGAIPVTLIESVLFGHVKGAFTGADHDAPGIFEQAEGGTVLLDEVGELSQGAQAALLRVLETKRVTRVGATDEIAVNVRVLAATHRNLEEMAETGTFRTDLLYRLNTMVLTIPPLRDRPEDVEPLAERFLAQARQGSASPVNSISEEARLLLRSYSWPGNVRELKNTIDRALIMSQGTSIEDTDLPKRLLEPEPNNNSVASVANIPPDSDFKDQVRQYEVDLILDALRRAEGNQTQAAKLLRMPLRTLVHKIKSYGIRKMYS